MISKHIVIWHMVTIVSVLVVMTVLSRRPLAPWHNASDDAVVHENSATQFAPAHEMDFPVPICPPDRSE
jgi:hypothetical protein